MTEVRIPTSYTRMLKDGTIRTYHTTRKAVWVKPQIRPADIEKARLMIADGMPKVRVARKMGISVYRLNNALNKPLPVIVLKEDVLKEDVPKEIQ